MLFREINSIIIVDILLIFLNLLKVMIPAIPKARASVQSEL